MTKKKSTASKSRNESDRGLLIAFTDLAWEDYQHWAKTDPNTRDRVNALIKAARKSPLKGIGKPERLKGDLTGYMSRRINKEDRLVYTVRDRYLVIVQCRFHY